MFTNKEIEEICNCYNLKNSQVSEFINTTKSDADQRYNYIINSMYVLKITNSRVVNEKYIADMHRLIKKYNEAEIYCPKICKTIKNQFTDFLYKNGEKFVFYLEKKSKYKTRKESGFVDYIFKKQMLNHLGTFASRYQDVDLLDTWSMWSVVELSPYDILIDEKQDNFNELISCLKVIDQNILANRLDELNRDSRNKIKEYMKRLPRCVFQGDLNDSNILVDKQGKFQGLIDFNMFGTEININCFLNESMYYITQDDFEKLTGLEILNKVIRVQEDLLAAITSQYYLNQDEREAKYYYNNIIYTSFWPNVVLMIQLINENRYVDKIIEFLSEISKR
jgi:hypothetical protein